MVVDHHQLNVFGLILYASRCMWGLRRNKKFASFLRKPGQTNPLQGQGKHRDQLASCMRHLQKRRKDKSIRMNFAELNQVCPFPKFQIKMRAARGA